MIMGIDRFFFFCVRLHYQSFHYFRTMSLICGEYFSDFYEQFPVAQSRFASLIYCARGQEEDEGTQFAHNENFQEDRCMFFPPDVAQKKNEAEF